MNPVSIYTKFWTVSKGMTVNVWTVNSPQEMLDFMAMGVDLITTDYPDQLKEIIAKFTE
ncbi:MAG: hypothetical protein KHX11_23985 [Bacteroides cellulosilyticus]|nr:hypothetical protein [Bacteroides cellulosilyticus]